MPMQLSHAIMQCSWFEVHVGLRFSRFCVGVTGVLKDWCRGSELVKGVRHGDFIIMWNTLVGG